MFHFEMRVRAGRADLRITEREEGIMTKSYTVTGTSQGISIEGAIQDALTKVKPSNVADALIMLKVTEIKVNTGGIAGILETVVKGKITSS
jgi:hypothetical protein